MQETSYVLPAESIVNIGFQAKGINYNLHINTINGIIKLEHANTKENKEDIFVHII